MGYEARIPCAVILQNMDVELKNYGRRMRSDMEVKEENAL